VERDLKAVLAVFGDDVDGGVKVGLYLHSPLSYPYKLGFITFVDYIWAIMGSKMEFCLLCLCQKVATETE
jgi:hypothetical protein